MPKWYEWVGEHLAFHVVLVAVSVIIFDVVSKLKGWTTITDFIRSSWYDWVMIVAGGLIVGVITSVHFLPK